MRGFGALVDALGPSNAIRFMRICDQSIADYTGKRHMWLDQYNAEDVARLAREEEANWDKDKRPGEE